MSFSVTGIESFIWVLNPRPTIKSYGYQKEIQYEVKTRRTKKEREGQRSARREESGAYAGFVIWGCPNKATFQYDINTAPTTSNLVFFYFKMGGQLHLENLLNRTVQIAMENTKKAKKRSANRKMKKKTTIKCIRQEDSKSNKNNQRKYKRNDKQK